MWLHRNESEPRGFLRQSPVRGKMSKHHQLFQTAQSVQSLGYGMDDRGSFPGWGTEGIPSLRRIRTEFGPTQPLNQWVAGEGGVYTGEKRLGREKLTIHLHLLQRLRTRGSIPTLPHTSSWHSA
jgi:hypothetical protein